MDGVATKRRRICINIFLLHKELANNFIVATHSGRFWTGEDGWGAVEGHKLPSWPGNWAKTELISAAKLADNMQNTPPNCSLSQISNCYPSQINTSMPGQWSSILKSNLYLRALSTKHLGMILFPSQELVGTAHCNFFSYPWAVEWLILNSLAFYYLFIALPRNKLGWWISVLMCMRVCA